MISDFTAQELAVLAVLCWSPWLIPHNVLLNAQNAGSAGKRTWVWVHRPNGPQFNINMAVRITSEHTCTYARNALVSQNLSRTCNRVVAYRDCLTHKPITEHHLVLPEASALPLDWRIGTGCAMAAERWVWANEISTLFLRWDQCLPYWHGEFARTQISLRNDQRKTASPCAVKALITNAWL